MKRKPTTEPVNEKTDSATPEPDSQNTPLSIHLDFKEIMAIFRDAILRRKGFIASIDQAIKSNVSESVQRGEMTEENAEALHASVMNSIQSNLDKASQTIDNGIHRTLTSLHLISTRDIENIESRLDRIIATLQTKSSYSTESPRKSRSKKKVVEKTKRGSARANPTRINPSRKPE